jgi:hypothetical protein
MPLNNTLFVKIMLTIISAFVLLHLILWNIYTKQFYNLPNNQITGDLSRMSYDIQSRIIRKKNTIQFFSLITWDKKPIDLLTIGDSFSNGAGGHYYQNYLVEKKGLRVLNIQALSSVNNYIETIIALYHSGLLKKIQPKSILIEVVQRNSIEFLSSSININKTINLSDLTQNQQYQHDRIPPIVFINPLNYNALLYNLLYQFNDKAYLSSVYKMSLNTHFFSNQKKQPLLFFANDIHNIKKTTPQSITQLNNNLNTLNELLTTHNIRLYFMPIINKYELYAPYIKNNPYPSDHFFNLLTHAEKHYYFINTQHLLREALKQGTKDIFWADDTHWTKKAIKTVFSNINFQSHTSTIIN